MNFGPDFPIGGQRAHRLWFTVVVIRTVFLGLTGGMLVGWWILHGYTVAGPYRWVNHPPAELVAVTVLLTVLNFADLVFRYRKDPT